MKTSNNRIVTVRLSPEDIRYLSELSVIRSRTRSEVIRGMLARARGEGSIEIKTLESVRYAACLLTSLVRRMSKANPDEAEAMITNALMEARKEVNS